MLLLKQRGLKAKRNKPQITTMTITTKKTNEYHSLPSHSILFLLLLYVFLSSFLLCLLFLVSSFSLPFKTCYLSWNFSHCSCFFSRDPNIKIVSPPKWEGNPIYTYMYVYVPSFMCMYISPLFLISSMNNAKKLS